ncbi:ABC transporter permease [Gluconacetobacter sacchari DSM 12717]|uniref:ABC transporter permease n=2 Tax=Gluconacetobacter sacchari TaxID=92759 RepID=A0A7W4IF89_9PROT|nr:ABC transporter permease [Gluconacetobacter sacchari]MBB2161766.1 ABC transporter permease [Gluconacetobacter sacchari]GBQ20065.1 ABC transporter permease [Gluconacetobacter sacchari DSM 12717]
MHRLTPFAMPVVLPWTILGLYLAVAILAPYIAPADPLAATGAPLSPLFGSSGILGTDGFGRDVASRLIWGLRPMLAVSFGAVFLATLAGGAYGLVAGGIGGRTDWLMMSVVDVMMSIPLILAAILVMAALGGSVINLIISVGISQIPVFARLARALASVEARKEYVLAARAVGLSRFHVLVREILPNIVRPLLVQAGSVVATAGLTAAALSYLGLGVRPPAPDIGYMVKEGQELIFIAPGQTLLPGLVLGVFALTAALCGETIGQERRR